MREPQLSAQQGSEPTNQDSALILELLRRRAKESAAALRWNAYTLMFAYFILAVTVILALRDAGLVVVASVAALGLASIWIVSRLRARRVEDRLFEDEIRKYADMLSGQPQAQSPADATPSTNSPLTDREVEILRQIACGRTNRQAAFALKIGEQTVKNHLSHIYSKLGVTDRTSAVLVAMRLGWVKSHEVTPAGEDYRE